MATCSVSMPGRLKTVVREWRGVKKPCRVSRSNGRRLMLRAYAGRYMKVRLVFAM